MGLLIKLIDAVLLFFFLVVILAAPAFDAQVCFPSKFFPNFLVDLNLWFTIEYGDYLLIEKPSFFVGLMWLELLFQWPLAIANLYAILVGGKPWFNSTCLVYGVSVFTGMVFSFFSFSFSFHFFAWFSGKFCIIYWIAIQEVDFTLSF
ncbi:hypothetical protein CsSME_00019203 [Camellia sinensis var. sinensis]